MALRFKVRISLTLLLLVAFLVCGPAGAVGALAQRLPSATERERKNKSTSSRRESRPKPQPPPPGPRNPVSVESGNFLALGNDFRKQKKWKAAEAAYKEAVKVWPANVDALLELGLLYLDRNRIEDAHQTHSELRLLNANYASNLLAEINRHKATLAH
jgi:tetratricopeptide (TPR) repeat protein